MQTIRGLIGIIQQPNKTKDQPAVCNKSEGFPLALTRVAWWKLQILSKNRLSFWYCKPDCLGIGRGCSRSPSSVQVILVLYACPFIVVDTLLEV